jgi:dihydroneopterin aldolase
LSATIVKFGGSLAASPLREAWLAAFLAARVPLILVPGGGPFAQAVRAAQKSIGFSDDVAHRLALLAMEQFAHVLAAFSATFVLCGSILAMDEASRLGRIPVWLPSAMVLGAPEIPVSWAMTSDSLSAWFAAAYGARRLLLIKSCDPMPPLSTERLAAEGIVDPLFPSFASRCGADIWLAGPAAVRSAAALLHQGGMPGMAVAVPAREEERKLV